MTKSSTTETLPLRSGPPRVLRGGFMNDRSVWGISSVFQKIKIALAPTAVPTLPPEFGDILEENRQLRREKDDLLLDIERMRTSTIQMHEEILSLNRVLGELWRGRLLPMETGLSHDYRDSEYVRFIGWSHEEDGHRWSLGERTYLRLRLPNENPPNSYELYLWGDTFGSQEIAIEVDGRSLAQDRFEGPVEMRIPLAGIERSPGEDVELGLRFSNPQAPCEMDQRPLAFAVKRLTIVRS